MQSLDDLPLDVIKHEIIPKMNYEQLRNMARTSKKYKELARETLPKYIASGGLQEEEWGPERIYELAKRSDEDIKIAVIKSFLEKLRYRAPVYDYLRDTWEADEKFLFGPTDPTEKEIKNYITQRRDTSLIFIGRRGQNWNLKDYRDDMKPEMGHLFRNPNVTLTEMKDYITRNPNSFMKEYITWNPNITPQDVLNNPYIPWDKLALSSNSNFTVDFIQANPNFPGTSSWKIGGLSGNSNIITLDKQLVAAHDRLKFYGNPNFRIEDLREIFQHPEFFRRNLRETYYPNNINLKYADVLNREGKFKQGTEAIASNPNITGKDLSSKTSLWEGNWAQRTLPENPNFSLKELTDKIGIIGALRRNPNYTLDYAKKYPILWYSKSYVSEHKFAKDPKLRYLLYSYIYKLLPEQVTVKINDQDVTTTKEFFYGMLATISTLKLDYDISYQRFPLVLEDYKMFTKGNANQPYMLKIEGFPFHFTSLEFLSGVKHVYETNNIPFNIPGYYDKDNNWQLIAIQ